MTPAKQILATASFSAALITTAPVMNYLML